MKSVISQARMLVGLCTYLQCMCTYLCMKVVYVNLYHDAYVEVK